MIKTCLKNLCLIGFALVGPIYLPAGGIQRTLNLENAQEIILTSNCTIYCSPYSDSKKLRLIPAGSPLLILNNWVNSENEKWVRIELSIHPLITNHHKPRRGWIKI